MNLELNLILSVLWAFMISVFAIPSVIHVAHMKNLLDEPNFRTMHSSLTPRLGGLAIFAGLISALTIFGKLDSSSQRVLAGAMLLFFIGLKDDIVSVSAFKKFFVQILATGILIFMGDVRITSFQGFGGVYTLDPGVSYGFTFLTVIGITNAINLIDGLDGLAGSIITLISLVFGTYFMLHGLETYGYLAYSLAGAMLGFLRYNIHKAIIFMGDTGSLVCGFLVSVMAIEFVEHVPVDSAPSIAVATILIPIFDTARVFGVRILNGKSPFSPDKNHIHHILSRWGLSQLQTVGSLILANALVVGLVIRFSHLGDNVLLYALIGLFVLITVGLELSNRLGGHKPGSPKPLKPRPARSTVQG